LKYRIYGHKGVTEKEYTKLVDLGVIEKNKIELGE
jgi:hypothetical protein